MSCDCAGTGVFVERVPGVVGARRSVVRNVTQPYGVRSSSSDPSRSRSSRSQPPARSTGALHSPGRRRSPDEPKTAYNALSRVPAVTGSRVRSLLSSLHTTRRTPGEKPAELPLPASRDSGDLRSASRIFWGGSAGRPSRWIGRSGPLVLLGDRQGPVGDRPDAGHGTSSVDGAGRGRARSVRQNTLYDAVGLSR